MHARLAHANRNFHYSQAWRPPPSEGAGRGPQHPAQFWRAEIVLLNADGVGTNEIIRRTGTSKTCVWRWQERFMKAGYDSLLHDKTRPSRIPPPLALGITERVAQTAPPTEATHWTSAMMAKVVGISASSVQRIWRAHGRQPHRVKQFKLSPDPRFVDKLRDVANANRHCARTPMRAGTKIRCCEARRATRENAHHFARGH